MMDKEEATVQHEKVIVIGSGPAGLTAALYMARAILNPLVIVGDQLGGQIALSSEVENYPAFVDAIGGFELTDRMQKQAAKFGTRYEYDEVVGVDFSQRPFHINTHSKRFTADVAIVTAGASPRKLGVPGEEAYWGRGVSTCATCDGFFYKGKKVVVVGGGDSALEEGLFLTKFADEVTIVHRRDALRAGPVLQKRAFGNEKIRFVWDTIVEEVVGNEQKVTGVRLKHVKTGEVSHMETDGFFLFIGHIPNSQIFDGQLELDEQGFIISDELMRTNVEGVFVAGEIQDAVFRQVATSVGQGCAAAMSAERWLAEQD